MEISSLGFSSLPLIHNCLKPNSISNATFLTSQKPLLFKPHSNFTQHHFSILNTTSSRNTTCIHCSIPFKNHKETSFLKFTMALITAFCAPFPCFAIETTFANEQISDRIDLEAILVSIDDFFNRNPFFVSGVTFIWLVVIPLTQEYLRKYKFVSAIDAFQKLKSDPNSQLLDIRDKASLNYLGTPNLKILNKKAVQVEFLEGQEDGFVKKVLQNFKDPGNTIICILDNFDGNSMKVAELLFKNGFKEAYAIRGGLRGKKGWQSIQETLLPPSVHVFPKKGKASRQLEKKEGTDLQTNPNGQVPVNKDEIVENGYINKDGPSPQATLGSSRSLSPYPNYPDLKPPSSPMPSKPKS